MSDVSIEVINGNGEDVGTVTLVRDGKPHVYWLNVYRDMGLTAAHSERVINKLDEGVHYIKLTRAEIKPFLTSINSALIPPVKAYYFLTSEGWNRALLEIETDSMLNREAADFIEATKDKMAAVYTRYQSGETLSLATDQTPALMGEVTTDPEKQIRLYNTARKIAISLGADRRAINTVMIEKIKEECPEVYPFMAMIPQGKVSDSPDDAVLTRKEVSGILKVEQSDLEERIINVGWVNKTALGWLLTPKGTKYLKPDPHAGNKKVWYDIRFGLDSIRLLKQEFEQQVLTGGYLSSGQSKGYLPDLIPTGRNKSRADGFPGGYK